MDNNVNMMNGELVMNVKFMMLNLSLHYQFIAQNYLILKFQLLSDTFK